VQEHVDVNIAIAMGQNFLAGTKIQFFFLVHFNKIAAFVVFIGD